MVKYAVKAIVTVVAQIEVEAASPDEAESIGVTILGEEVSVDFGLSGASVEFCDVMRCALSVDEIN